ncbi:hypothetical protein [Reyranella sp.]|uniref:hypothetical protein n=1 Tax=Reyranella sp. TaxID=1929291 RepID=UPI003C7CC6CB
MSEQMNAVDRNVMVAAQLAAALTEPGDDAKTAVDHLAAVLKEMRCRGGVTQLWRAAKGQS